jgi:quinol monooxygenase YgiN
MNIIHAHIKVKPEFREQFLDKVKDLVKHSQAEEGNISYQLFENTAEQNAFVMVEEWNDEDAIKFHNQTPHFKEFGSLARDFLQEPPSVDVFDAEKKQRK